MGDVYKALADPTRRAILDELAGRSGQTLFELCVRLTNAHGLSSSRQAVSQHLAVLEDAGLVVTRRQGRFKFHDLDTSPLRAVVERWPITDQRSPPEITNTKGLPPCGSTSRASSSPTRTPRSPSTPTSSGSPRRPRSPSASTAG